MKIGVVEGVRERKRKRDFFYLPTKNKKIKKFPSTGNRAGGTCTRVPI